MLLREKDRQTLLKIFSEVTVPIEIWAYGSRVKGSAHEGSDLDLVVLRDDHTSLPTDIFEKLIDKIRESNIPILVELRDWAQASQKFSPRYKSAI